MTTLSVFSFRPSLYKLTLCSFLAFCFVLTAGSYSPTAVTALTSVPIEPNADPFLRPFMGENLGFASSQGRAYVSFTGQAYMGIFADEPVPGANNLVLGFTY